MTELRTTSRPSASARRVGYVIAAAVNAVLLWLIHVEPGWDAVPFLTPETPQVLGAIDAALIAGIAVDVVQVAWDPRWLTTVGSLVTTSFGLAAMVRLLQVFPFAFGPGSDWALVVRILLVLGIVGTAIALLVNLVALLRLLGSDARGPRGRRGPGR
jgi:hypothetical protein